MNCYLCFAETGSASRPALAICQRCGAAICESHLILLRGPSVAGLAGMPHCIVICSRCYEPLPVKKPLAEEKPVMLRNKLSALFAHHRWPSQLHQPSLDLPEPGEAVKAVEQFLSPQRK